MQFSWQCVASLWIQNFTTFANQHRKRVSKIVAKQWRYNLERKSIPDRVREEQLCLDWIGWLDLKVVGVYKTAGTLPFFSSFISYGSENVPNRKVWITVLLNVIQAQAKKGEAKIRKN